MDGAICQVLWFHFEKLKQKEKKTVSSFVIITRKRCLMMAPTIKGQNSSRTSYKRISLNLKLKVLEKLETKKVSEVSRCFNLPDSTVRNIKKNKSKIVAAGECVSSGIAEKTFRPRHKVVHATEGQLYTWIMDQKTKKGHVDTSKILAKAKSIYAELRKEEKDVPNFNFSQGWFANYKSRFHLKSIFFNGETRTAEINPFATFLKYFKKVVSDGGYSSKQVYNAGEYGLFWKRMHTEISGNQEETRLSEYNGQKKLPILFLTNAFGDAKLTPMFMQQIKKPSMLKNYDEEALPVIGKYNRKDRVTQQEFSDWFSNYFVPYVDKYNKDQNLSNRALLLIDNSTNHSANLLKMYPHIQSVFLPPNTTSMLQPLDQGIIATFKSFYLRSILRNLTSAFVENGDNINSYWKKFNMKMAEDLLSDSWRSISQSTMNTCWKKVWPECVVSQDICINTFEACDRESLQLIHKAGFHNVSLQAIQELLTTQQEDASDESIQTDNIPIIEEKCTNVLGHCEDLSNETLLRTEYLNVCDTNTKEVLKLKERKSPEKLKCIAEFFFVANNLKILLSKVEEDERKCNAFKLGIDALMSFYKHSE